MIYCAVQPIEEYDCLVQGVPIGLYTSYAPDMLALILLTSLLPFDYEPETAVFPTSSRYVKLSDDSCHKETLDMLVGEDTVRDLITTINPVMFFNKIKDLDVSSWPLAQAIPGGQKVMKTIIGVRACHWGRSYRGRTSENNNVIRATFGLGLLANSMPTDIIALYYGVMEKFKDGNR